MIKLSLRNRFILYFSPLIVCIFAFGIYNIRTFAFIHNHFEKLQQDVTPTAIAMLELKKILLSLESGIKEKRIDKQQVAESIRQLKKLVSAHGDHENLETNPTEKASHDTMHHVIRTMSLSEYIINQAETGWQDSELATVAEMIHQELISLGPVLDEHLQIHLQQLTETEDFLSLKYQHTLIFVSLAGAAVMVLAVIIFMAMMRSVLGPVKILQEGTRQIGAGNLRHRLAISSGDEFEFLAEEFSKMADKLSQYHESLDLKVQERTRELLDANSELQKAEEQVHFLSQELLEVQEAERQQISLDLHDNVAQELSSLKVASESILEDASQGKSVETREIGEWASLLDRCIKTVRELSYNLRPPGLEQIGLPSAISDYCRDFTRKNNIGVNFSKAGVDTLQLEFNYAINIYRLVQEALNNIKKHADARTVEVKMVSSHPNLILRIEDDGRGFDLDAGYLKARKNKRFGLLGMRERVRMMHGAFRIQATPGQGTRIFIEIPLDPTDVKQ
ncbi:MAG: sensor histidine kinase [Proteobacteria bacterium]|nr:sensor histidine kinase [Pseudomonadota bacterium]MBU1738991.1 sensor histidine kinase [Pseudomonadota bacterium]